MLSTSFRTSYYAKMGVGSAMPSSFGSIPSGSRCGNDPNKLVHGAGLPILDNHYYGYKHKD